MPKFCVRYMTEREQGAHPSEGESVVEIASDDAAEAMRAVFKQLAAEGCRNSRVLSCHRVAQRKPLAWRKT